MKNQSISIYIYSNSLFEDDAPPDIEIDLYQGTYAEDALAEIYEKAAEYGIEENLGWYFDEDGLNELALNEALEFLMLKDLSELEIALAIHDNLNGPAENTVDFVNQGNYILYASEADVVEEALDDVYGVQDPVKQWIDYDLAYTDIVSDWNIIEMNDGRILRLAR